MSKITIYQFTDPTCVWCWGNEPTIRAIEYLYSGKVAIEYVMGGLVEDVTSLYKIEGDTQQVIREANKRIYENWLSSSSRHGMPVCQGPITLYSELYRSSFPQNIAYKAARRVSPDKSSAFLRRIREATFIDNKRTSQMDVLIEIATEVGLSAAEFIEQYTYGDAQTDFMRDRIMCQRNRITGFPSYMITKENTTIILSGYQDFNTISNIVTRLTKGKIKPRRLGPSLRNVTAFIKHFSTVFPAEIEVTFALDKDKTDLIISTLLKEGKVESEELDNGIRLKYISNIKHSQRKNRA